MTGQGRALLMAASMVAVGGVAPAWAQTPAPARAPARPAAPQEEKLTEQKEGAKPKTLWDEFKLFSFVEMGATFNLNGGSEGVPGSTSNGWTNTLRLYDIYQGYTFNMAEFSIKRDPDEAFPFGMGLVLTAGRTRRRTTRSASCATTTTRSRSATRRCSTSRKRTSRGGSRSAMAPWSRSGNSSRCSATR